MKRAGARSNPACGPRTGLLLPFRGDDGGGDGADGVGNPRFAADGRDRRTNVRSVPSFGFLFCDITFEISAKSMFNRKIGFVCNTCAKSLFTNRKAVDQRDFFPYSAAKWEKVG
jgi:hypothetical protein